MCNGCGVHEKGGSAYLSVHNACILAFMCAADLDADEPLVHGELDEGVQRGIVDATPCDLRGASTCRLNFAVC